MTQKTVAEIFIETLIAAGVTRIYGVVGDSLNGILEEVRRKDRGVLNGRGDEVIDLAVSNLVR